jgi:hypothetical protein
MWSICQRICLLYNTFSLKNPENGYWTFVGEFTHPEVKKDVDDNPDVHSIFDKGKTQYLVCLCRCAHPHL